MSWASKFSKPYRVGDGEKFRFKDHDPADTANLKSEERAGELLAKGVARMAELQDKLYAQDRWALLLIFQGMDAAGKDGVIKHVMSGVSPLGCQVYAFKTPSEEDLDHDYLWRHVKCLPERGRIGIFNRSHYEEVLIVRVHPEILANERMPAPLVTKNIWQERFEDICSFEHYLSRNGFVIRKFFLNVSKKEQKKRFLDRAQQPEKNWKFSASDLHEREHWDEYMDAYEEAIANTATPQAPWFVIPADNKWFTRLAVAAVIVDTLDGLNLAYPKVDAQKKKELEAARKVLLGNKRV
jgi:PPK2 family polyphosphate:nucleotide phosphotransferase